MFLFTLSCILSLRVLYDGISESILPVPSGETRPPSHIIDTGLPEGFFDIVKYKDGQCLLPCKMRVKGWSPFLYTDNKTTRPLSTGKSYGRQLEQ